MRNLSSFENWATKYPPSTIFHAIERGSKADPTDEDEELSDEEFRAGCQHVVELLETAAKFNPEAMVHGTPSKRPPKKVPLAKLQEVVVTLTTIREFIEVGIFEHALTNHAPDLLQRFRAVEEVGLRGLSMVRAIMHASVVNKLGELRKEKPGQRLARSVRLATDDAPMYLGTFAQYADDE